MKTNFFFLPARQARATDVRDLAILTGVAIAVPLVLIGAILLEAIA